jgi:Fungal specific transcription factor domain
MLYNAFLACGARHLALVNAKYTDDKALHYYNTATTYLLNALQNPNRDTVICATTAVILNVYEVMCERALQRMNHIAGARALIKECGWNARATGIGAACFWLNIGMELISCLHFNWQVAWDPDEWGVDMEFVRETEQGKEELWTHRILYIVAKIANFRASVPRHQESSPQTQHLRLQNRYNEWKRLKGLADSWNDNIPRTMHPMAYISPYQTMSGSNFPEIWLIKRASIVARLFYHTAMVLLAQVNPIAPSEQSEEMREMQRNHSILVCGIVAHVKDR